MNPIKVEEEWKWSSNWQEKSICTYYNGFGMFPEEHFIMDEKHKHNLSGSKKEMC